MRLLQPSSPTCVVDHNVEEDATTSKVCRIREFSKLIYPGGSTIEFHQRRIHRRQVLRGVGAAVTSHAGIGRWRRSDRQQLQHATIQRLDDVRQMLDQISKLSGAGNHRETAFIQLLQLLVEFWILRRNRRLRLTKHSDECAINRVGGSVTVRMDADADVGSLWPPLPPLLIDGVGFSPEESNFRQSNITAPFALFELHRNITP